MRIIALILAVLLGYLLNDPPQYTELQGKTWCYEDTYADLNTIKHDSYFININAGKYDVYIPCVVK